MGLSHFVTLKMTNRFQPEVGFDVYLHHSGPFLADETNKALKDAANSKSQWPQF